MDMRQMVGREIAKEVKNNQVLGLGTGLTCNEAIKAIGERVKVEKLRVTGIPTSNRTAQLAIAVGIHVIPTGVWIPGQAGDDIDWGFDGADEVERHSLNILKGMGGAMTLEKSVAKKCPRWIVIIDESKLVDKLGEHFGKIPVEVKEDQMGRIIENLYEKYQPVDITVRQATRHAELDSASHEIPKQVRDDNMYRTDFGNPVIDVHITPGTIKTEWEKEWEMMPGVVGTGLFLGGYTDEVWVGKSNGAVEKIKGVGRR